MSRDHPVMSPDERDDLVASADAAARRNRPAWLVTVGVVALLAAGAYAGLAWYSLNSARQRAAGGEHSLTRLAELAATLGAYEAAAEQEPEDNIGRDIPTLLSDIERDAEQAGIENKPAVPKRDWTRLGNGLRRASYSYSITDPSAAALLGWVNRVSERVPDMRVRSLGLMPVGNQWKLDVTFARVVRQ